MGVGLLVGITLVGLLTLEYDWRQAIGTSLIGIMLALSLVVLTGYVGQISLAQMAIAGFSAFWLTVLSDRLGVPSLAPLLSACAATVLGMLVADSRRCACGVNLAVITLSLAVVVDRMVLNNSTITNHDGAPMQADTPQVVRGRPRAVRLLLLR